MLKNLTRSLTTSTRVFPPLLGRYKEKTPIELFRIMPGTKVQLRDYDYQMAKKRASYDLHLHEGKVLPRPGDKFEGIFEAK
jgi:hypothetical protein